eukprot:scaffold350113_cov41-Prasinocladus_malaysianus.AAC.1
MLIAWHGHAVLRVYVTAYSDVSEAEAARSSSTATLTISRIFLPFDQLESACDSQPLQWMLLCSLRHEHCSKGNRPLAAEVRPLLATSLL